MIKVINKRNIKQIKLTKSLLEQEFVREKYNDDSEGFFQCIKINTIEQLEYLFKQIKIDEESKNLGFIYRGQRDTDWLLESSIVRRSKNSRKNYSEHLENFRQLARGKLSEQSLLKKTQEYEYLNELWAVGQHMGLYTPLLDWSKNFYVGLFFAFIEEKSSTYRAVYRTNQNFFYRGEGYISECFIPYSDPVGRINAQQGLFITQQGILNLNNAIERIDSGNLEEAEKRINKIYLAVKFYIRSSLRNEILNYLKHIGISYETVYPDLLGAIKKANSDFDENK